MSNSLYGFSVSSTFQRLVQVVEGSYYDGLGNLLNIGSGSGSGGIGPTGPQGATGSPGVSLMWMGSWTQSMYYVSYDAVTYNGSSYICLTNNPQNPPGLVDSEWDLLAQGGQNISVTGSNIWGLNTDGSINYNNFIIASNSIATSNGKYIVLSINGITASSNGNININNVIGATGPQGATGSQGIQGVTGPQGISFNNQAPYKYVTSSYTITNTDYYLDCNGTFNIILPNSIGATGTSYIIKNSGTGVINISTTASQLIDNLPSFNLAFYDTLTVESNGSNWKVTHPQTKQFIRVYNNTGSIIPKGSALAIQSSYNGIPSVTLPIASGVENQQVIGLAYIDIPIASEGIVISSGILSGLNLSQYNIGDILYLSDTVAGGFVNTTSSLLYSSRTNQIGYITNNSSTLGTIQIEIINENINLSLTDIQRNILEGNVISTGTYEFLGLSVSTPTTFNISPMKGWIVDNTGTYSSTHPTVNNVIFSGATGVSALNISTADNTYVLIGPSANVITQNTFPTPFERRQNIFLGKVVHPNHVSIQNINNTVDYDVSPVSMVRDIWTPIKLINEGISVSANDGNLSINISSGYLWGNGINWTNNQLDPNRVNFTSLTSATFQYRTSVGATATGATAGTFLNRTTLLVDKYESSPGVLSNVGTPNAQSTNIRVYAFPTGLIRLQFGQHIYPNLTTAAASVNSENFNVFSNNATNGILIGVISVRRDATNLSDNTQALFTPVSKFGEVVGGAAGGASTVTLQQAFNNSSTNPDILTNDQNPSFIIKNGDGADTTNVLIVQSLTGSTTFEVSGEGNVKGKSFITSNGSYSQFVKGDGSLDSSSYLTASSLLSYQPLLNNPIIGTGSNGQISFFSGTNSITSANNLIYDRINNLFSISSTLLIGTMISNGVDSLQVSGSIYSLNGFESMGNVGLMTTTPTHTLTLASTSTGIVYYNTSNQLSNFERIRQYWSGNIYNILSESSGTGVSTRSIRIGVERILGDGTPGRYLDINQNPSLSTGNFVFTNIGSATTGHMVNIQGLFNGSTSTTQNALSLATTISQTAANAINRQLFISPLFSSNISTNNFLIDAGMNSSSGGSGTHTSFFVLTNSGSIGIGTASPLSTLHVISSNFNPIIVERNTNSNTTIQFKNTTATTWYSGLAGGGNYGIGIQADLGTSNLFNISASGSVGIGTNVPTHTITLASASTGIAMYNTADQTTNFERVRFFWNSNNFNIRSEGSGSGSTRTISINANNRFLLINGFSQLIGAINIQESVTTAGAASFGISSVFTSNSGTQYTQTILPTINQSGTAGYRGLWISPFEQGTGSGNRFLLDIGTNTAASGAGTHSSVFSVNSSGTTLIGTSTNNGVDRLQVSGNINLSGVLKSGSGTFTKLGSAPGDLLLDSGGVDSPGVLFYYGNNTNWGIDTNYEGSNQRLRFVLNLNESNGSVKANLDTNGNFNTTGYLDPQAWKVGQVIQTRMLMNSDLTQLQQNNGSGLGNYFATDSFDKDVFYGTFTPFSSSSFIIVEFFLSKYTAQQGSGSDSYFSRIKACLQSSYVRDSNGVNNVGVEIGYNWQGTQANNSSRTGSLFPLVGRYTNTDTNIKLFSISVRRDSADDFFTYDWSSTSVWMKITEIAR